MTKILKTGILYFSLIMTLNAYAHPVPSQQKTATIVVTNDLHFGYIAYAHTMAHVISHHYPEFKLQIIIETGINDLKSRVQKSTSVFLFPDSAETLWLEKTFSDKEEHPSWSYHEPNEFNKAQQWIDQSNIIIIAPTILETSLTILSDRCILIKQIIDLDYPSDYHTQYILLFNNFISLRNSLKPNSAKDQDDLFNAYWAPRSGGFLPITTIQGWLPNSGTLDYASQKLDNYLKTPKNPVGIVPIPSQVSCRYNIDTGLGEKQSGILINPHVLQKAQTGKEAFTSDFHSALNRHPELAILMEESKTTPSTYHYYIAYKHSTIDYAEYVATVVRINENPAWILSNLSQKELDTSLFRKFMAQHNIETIVFHEVANSTQTETITTTAASGKTVHLVHLPLIDEDEYTALFAHSTAPAGVTSNHSLFLAITLGLLPMYSPNNPLQSGLNYHLAQFDNTGVLHHIFRNEIDPELKAVAIQRALKQPDIVKQWACTLMANKSANPDILASVDRIIEGTDSNLHPVPYPKDTCNWIHTTSPPLHYGRSLKFQAISVTITPALLLAVWVYKMKFK